VVIGTRVPVALVLGSLQTMSRQAVVDEYGITERDIELSLTYAAELVNSTSVVTFGGA